MLGQAWVGLEESVELAGDEADQAASDLAVGLGFQLAVLGLSGVPPSGVGSRSSTRLLLSLEWPPCDGQRDHG
jgi:hypothetical protein